jgi:hypothetical protein
MTPLITLTWKQSRYGTLQTTEGAKDFTGGHAPWYDVHINSDEGTWHTYCEFDQTFHGGFVTCKEAQEACRQHFERLVRRNTNKLIEDGEVTIKERICRSK